MMRNIFQKWPALWLMPIMAVVFFFSPIATGWLDDQIYNLTGKENSIPWTVFQIALIGVMVWMALADLALGGIKALFPTLYKFYDRLWKDDLAQLTVWQKHLLFLAYFSLLMLTGAIMIAQV